MMIGSRVVLLALGFASVVLGFPDCSVCNDHYGLCFVSGDLCHSYFMCVKKPNFNELSQLPEPNYSDLYTAVPSCCAEGLGWDQLHMTCKRDAYCEDPRDDCPPIPSITDGPCPHSADENDTTKYFTSTYEKMSCPSGMEWNQEYCTCISRNDIVAPCSKVLAFDFAGTYDSFSCNNFAKGDANGDASLEGDVLCLNGEDQYFRIGFLNNWCSWNPFANSFTLCVSVKPAVENQDAGILNTNCEMKDPVTGDTGSVVDLVLQGGELILLLGQHVIQSAEILPVNEWTKICVVFDKGIFSVYLNGDLFEDGIATFPYRFSPNTHATTTLGFKPGFSNFNGYVDDFCFFTEAQDAASINAMAN